MPSAISTYNPNTDITFILASFPLQFFVTCRKPIESFFGSIYLPENPANPYSFSKGQNTEMLSLIFPVQNLAEYKYQIFGYDKNNRIIAGLSGQADSLITMKILNLIPEDFHEAE